MGVMLQGGRYLSLGEVAELFGCQLWRVQRLYERKLLPAPPRVGPVRLVRAEDLPLIRQTLERAGYLRPAPADRSAAAGYLGPVQTGETPPGPALSSPA